MVSPQARRHASSRTDTAAPTGLSTVTPTTRCDLGASPLRVKPAHIHIHAGTFPSAHAPRIGRRCDRDGQSGSGRGDDNQISPHDVFHDVFPALWGISDEVL
jgi:hypothetical protein